MRWESLFADLEAQFEAAETAEHDAEVQERARHETGRRSLCERLRAAHGQDLRCALAGAGGVAGQVRGVGPDWVLLADGERETAREVVVALPALLWVDGLPRAAEVAPPGTIWHRLDLRYLLRGLARDRAPLRLVLTDATVLEGTVDRVGLDHVDVALHPAEELRRAAAVTGVRAVPLTAVALVRPG